VSEIRIEGVSKTFGDTIAVDDLSLVTDAGSFVTLLGPSGCGKTTTLRLIAGFETPDSGQIYMGDRLLNTIPSWKRELGFVFQNYALFPHLRVFDNVAFGLEMRRLPKNEVQHRVSKVLHLVGLSGLEERYPSQISGGQQQRVALARALVIEPQVLLLDEPLSNLDAKLREVMRIELKRIQNETGITSIYVTHDQEEALALSDTIIVMHNGRAVQIGTSKQIWERPASLFVADFIGVENLINGKIVEVNEREGTKFVSSEGKGMVQILGKHRDISPGTPITLGFRAFDLDVSVPHPEDEEDGWIGRIQFSTYKGELNIYQIETELSSEPLIAKIPKTFSIGQTVRVKLEPNNLLLLSE
jgi:ABC-type Fe3+/spermidine/putrescine transport system ATPase subunit